MVITSDRPLWFDRPCIENDELDEPGHKFMCEFNVPDQQKDLFGKIFPRFIVRYFHLCFIQVIYPSFHLIVIA